MKIELFNGVTFKANLKKDRGVIQVEWSRDITGKIPKRYECEMTDENIKKIDGFGKELHHIKYDLKGTFSNRKSSIKEIKKELMAIVKEVK